MTDVGLFVTVCPRSHRLCPNSLRMNDRYTLRLNQIPSQNLHMDGLGTRLVAYSFFGRHVLSKLRYKIIN